MVHAHVVARLNELLNTATAELRTLQTLVNQDAPEQSRLEIHAGRLSKAAAEAWVETRYAHLGPRGVAVEAAFKRDINGDRRHNQTGYECCWIRVADSTRIWVGPDVDPNKTPGAVALVDN